MTYLITNQNSFGNVGYPCRSFPKATVKSGGCGACAVLNCVENSTEYRWKMTDWIDYVIDNGGRVDGGTSITAILKALKRDYGFGYKATNNLEEVKNHLRKGGFAVFHGGYGNVFSSAGHYVCLAGITGNQAIVIDSGWYAGKYNTAARRTKVREGAQRGLVYVSFANVESDKKYKQNQGTNYYLVIAPTAKQESEEEEMIYKNIGEVPEWAKAAVQLRMDMGCFTDKNNFAVYDSNLVAWVVEDRADPFIKNLEDVPHYWIDDAKALVGEGVILGDGTNQIGMRQSTLKSVILAKRLA